MNTTIKPLSASQAASRLGVSVKALRLYEQRGLIAPDRNSAGWRAYGPNELARAAEIIKLRGLGFSLAQVGRMVGNYTGALEPALKAHEAALKNHARRISEILSRVQCLRSNLCRERLPPADRLISPDTNTLLSVSFDLPWPWGGEPFEMRDISPLNFITGPLGSGKTRFAKRLTEAFQDARFVELDRRADDGASPALNQRVELALAWLIERGAARSPALMALLAPLEAEGSSILVVDLVEQDLDQATQEALISYIRIHSSKNRTLFLMTRSSSILDLDAVRAGESIILCPANHSPPILVVPCSGTPGYEAVATCLATPAVRARTQGVMARRPQTAHDAHAK